MSTVYVAFPEPAEADIDEILRYAAIPKAGRSAEMRALAERCLGLTEGKLKRSVCYALLPVKVTGDAVDLGFAIWKSASLAAYLETCDKVILFAATVGLELDRLIAAKSVASPAKAHMLEAVGTERIEALCDAFSGYAAETYGGLKARFSPGYGDLPLEAQRDIFRVLEPQRRIGLSLTESMMMSPSKSVTAIIGVR